MIGRAFGRKNMVMSRRNKLVAPRASSAWPPSVAELQQRLSARPHARKIQVGACARPIFGLF
jgi:hypothetical protein